MRMTPDSIQTKREKLKKEISEMQQRVTITWWDNTLQSDGGTIYGVVSTYNCWAKKEVVNGSQVNNESHQQWSYNTTFLIRYNPDIKSNCTLDHNGDRWIINSVEILEPNYQEFMRLKVTHTDINI